MSATAPAGPARGAAETLRQLNLPGLAGRPAADVFVAILEFVCPPGGAVDEAIARQAMLETIGDMAEAGIGSFDTLAWRRCTSLAPERGTVRPGPSESFPLHRLREGKRLEFVDVSGASKCTYRQEYRQKSALLISLALFRVLRGMHLSGCIVFYRCETSAREPTIARTFGREQRHQRLPSFLRLDRLFELVGRGIGAMRT